MVLLTQSGGFLGPIAKILGWIFNFLFELASNFGILNIGLTIILFTIVVKLLMLPLTIKQMKFSKLTNIMNPELQAIRKKYEGKSDQNSIMKMNEEQNAVYAKYGVSPTGGCLQMLIQLPILFALYRVIQNIPAYVSSIKVLFENMLNGANGLMSQANFATIMSENGFAGDFSTTNKAIDAMNLFSVEQWDKLKELFPACANLITENVDALYNVYDFFGINLAVNPNLTSIAVIIPILTGVTQWLMMRTSGSGNADEDNPAAQTMKTMNTIMPFMIGFMGFSLPAGLGLYWIATAVVSTIQQLALNAYFNKIDVDKMVQKNIEKANAKRAKQGLPPQTLSTRANTNTKTINANNKTQDLQKKLEETRQRELEKVEEIKKSTSYYNEGTTKGSLAAKANMVARYNEKNNKK